MTDFAVFSRDGRAGEQSHLQRTARVTGGHLEFGLDTIRFRIADGDLRGLANGNDREGKVTLRRPGELELHPKRLRTIHEISRQRNLGGGGRLRVDASRVDDDRPPHLAGLTLFANRHIQPGKLQTSRLGPSGSPRIPLESQFPFPMQKLPHRDLLLPPEGIARLLKHGPLTGAVPGIGRPNQFDSGRGIARNRQLQRFSRGDRNRGQFGLGGIPDDTVSRQFQLEFPATQIRECRGKFVGDRSLLNHGPRCRQHRV